MGLRGINNEMNTLNSKSLAGLDSGLDLNVSHNGGGQAALSSGANINVSVTINGNATENDVRNGVSLGISDALRARGQA
jgi:hypothetical protein